MNLPRILLSIGEHPIRVHVARDAQAREQGLMHRASLGPDEGMLFVDDRPSGASFWMKNTPLDLSVAFIDDQGRILNIEAMAAGSFDGTAPVRPVRFALEMQIGWFAERGALPGTYVTGLPLPMQSPPLAPTSADR